MDFKVYFNSDYSAHGEANKVRIVFDLGDRGLFASTCDVRTGSCKSYASGHSVCDERARYRSQISGRSVNPYCTDCLSGFRFPDGCDQQAHLRAMRRCSDHLFNAATLFLKKSGIGLAMDEKNRIVSDINAISAYFSKDELDPSEAPSLHSPKGSEEREGEEERISWSVVDMTAIPSEELKLISQEIVRAMNPLSGISYNGRLYRMRMREDGNPEMLVSAGGEREEATSVPEKPSRKTEKMAMFKENAGFGGFMAGGFYRCGEIERLGGSSYVKVYNDLGEEYRVKYDRVEIIPVYCEAPEGASVPEEAPATV